MNRKARPLKIGSPAVPRRAGRREFAALVGAAPTATVALPLAHVTDAYAFRDIMSEEQLLPTPCNVFGGDLLYLFYGRPAYRSAAELESNGADTYWPICFVMKPDAARPSRIFPFDSGAFHHNRFAAFMDHRMIKEDFELDADPATPGRLVQLFWQNERAYFDADGLSAFAADEFAFEAKSYARLLRYEGRGPFDERNSAIEIQVDAPIALEGNTLAVILPQIFAKPVLLSRIEALGALALPFDVVRRHGPVEMVGQIYTIVRDLLGGKHGLGPGRCW